MKLKEVVVIESKALARFCFSRCEIKFQLYFTREVLVSRIYKLELTIRYE